MKDWGIKVEGCVWGSSVARKGGEGMVWCCQREYAQGRGAHRSGSWIELQYKTVFSEVTESLQGHIILR